MSCDVKWTTQFSMTDAAVERFDECEDADDFVDDDIVAQQRKRAVKQNELQEDKDDVVSSQNDLKEREILSDKSEEWWIKEERRIHCSDDEESDERLCQRKNRDVLQQHEKNDEVDKSIRLWELLSSCKTEEWKVEKISKWWWESDCDNECIEIENRHTRHSCHHSCRWASQFNELRAEEWMSEKRWVIIADDSDMKRSRLKRKISERIKNWRDEMNDEIHQEWREWHESIMSTSDVEWVFEWAKESKRMRRERREVWRVQWDDEVEWEENCEECDSEEDEKIINAERKRIEFDEATEIRQSAAWVIKYLSRTKRAEVRREQESERIETKVEKDERIMLDVHEEWKW